ncbi:phospholipid scramblase 2-like [Rhinophrynus dorsalis]
MFFYLLQINQLMVKEKFKVSQGWGRSFDVLSPLGQRIFQADQYVRFCGPLFSVKLQDNSGNEVVELIDSCKCSCTRQMEVHCPLGCPVGYVSLHWNQLITHMSVLNSNKELVFLIIGPSMRNSIFGNACFEVKSKDEEHVVGVIKNETEHFMVSFPLDLEVSLKAVLMASCLYLEAIIFNQRRALLRRGGAGTGHSV